MNNLTDNKWEMIEINFSDIGSTDIDDFSKKFRTGLPVLLVYKFNELPWVGVAKCAPLNHMLWAMEIKGYKQHESERLWVESLLNNKSIYESFRYELECANISKNEVPKDLMLPYCGWSTYLGKRELAFKTVSIGEFRVSGSLAPIKFKDSLINFYSKQLHQFNGLSFWPINENVEFNEKPSIESRRKGFLDSKLWRHPLISDFKDEGERQKILALQLEESYQVINKLESKKDLNLNIYFHDIVRPNPTFLIKKYESNYNGITLNIGVDDYPNTELDIELYACRARLIRLLGYPNFYRSIDSLPDFWSNLEKSFDEPLGKQRKSYNFVDELFAFKNEMEKKYPVLLENPLEGLNS